MHSLYLVACTLYLIRTTVLLLGSRPHRWTLVSTKVYSLKQALHDNRDVIPPPFVNLPQFFQRDPTFTTA